MESSEQIEVRSQMLEVGGKRCPRCEETLPLSDFGVCRARKDGLNLYCMLCIRQKIALSRQALREYKKVHGPRKGDVHRSFGTLNLDSNMSLRRVARVLRKLSPADRVLKAIELGAHRQRDIVKVTRLSRDEVCDALADLLLWSRKIRTQTVRHERMYFANEAAAVVKQKEVAPSFSAIPQLMTGRVRGLHEP